MTDQSTPLSLQSEFSKHTQGAPSNSAPMKASKTQDQLTPQAGGSEDQAVIEALQYYLRQSALTQRNHLPRWASW